MSQIDDGKKLFKTYSEAEKVAKTMSLNHDQAFQPNKIGSEYQLVRGRDGEFDALRDGSAPRTRRAPQIIFLNTKPWW